MNSPRELRLGPRERPCRDCGKTFMANGGTRCISCCVEFVKARAGLFADTCREVSADIDKRGRSAVIHPTITQWTMGEFDV